MKKFVNFNGLENAQQFWLTCEVSSNLLKSYYYKLQSSYTSSIYLLQKDNQGTGRGRYFENLRKKVTQDRLQQNKEEQTTQTGDAKLNNLSYAKKQQELQDKIQFQDTEQDDLSSNFNKQKLKKTFQKPDSQELFNQISYKWIQRQAMETQQEIPSWESKGQQGIEDFIQQNMSLVLDSADLHFRGQMPPSWTNRTMPYLESKDLSRAIDMELDQDLRLYLGQNPQMNNKIELSPKDFLGQFKEEMKGLLNLSEDQFQAQETKALQYFDERQQEYRKSQASFGDPIFDGGYMEQEEYLYDLLDKFMKNSYPFKQHITKSLQTISNLPDWTFHSREIYLRSMIQSLGKYSSNYMDEQLSTPEKPNEYAESLFQQRKAKMPNKKKSGKKK